MTETRFDLVFEGKLEPGHERDEVGRVLEGLFELDAAAIAQLFSGRAFVLGASMDEGTASSFQQALASAGAATRLVAADTTGSGEPTRERRSAQRRILARRRAQVRDAAILPDRRNERDRRR